MLGRVLGGHEHQHPRPAGLLREQLLQQLGAARCFHRDGALGDVGRRAGRSGDFDAQRIAQQALGQPGHARLEGGGKQQVLALRRQQCEHALQLFGESQVQQPVGLVQHQRPHLRERQGVVLHEVQQPARRGHHRVRAAAQGHQLRVDGHPAARDRDLQPRPGQMARQVAQHLAHLGGQFARGHQHQGARAPRPGRAPACCACGRSRCSSGRPKAAVLPEPVCAAQHVAPVQHGGNGLRLDGRGRVEAQGTGGVDEGGREAEGGKGHGGREGRGRGMEDAAAMEQQRENKRERGGAPRGLCGTAACPG